MLLFVFWVMPRLTSNLQSCCLSSPSTRMTGTNYHVQPHTVVLLQLFFEDSSLATWQSPTRMSGWWTAARTLRRLGKHMFKCYARGSDALVLQSLPQMDSFTQRESLISLKRSHWFLNAIYVELYSNRFIKHRNIRLHSIRNLHTITVQRMQLREITSLGEPGCIWIKVPSSQNF